MLQVYLVLHVTIEEGVLIPFSGVNSAQLELTTK